MSMSAPPGDSSGPHGHPDVSVARSDELEYFYHGAFGRLRAGLGLRAFGIQIVRMPPHSDIYPEHDHTENDQEEVYITVSGAATLLVGGRHYRLEPGVFIRVGAREVRKVVTESEPVELIVVGGTPGRAYEPPPYTDSGAALAVASAAPLRVRVGEEVTFDATGSSAGSESGELAYAWDFEGDGALVDTPPITTHAYDEPGTYTAVLQVSDNGGKSDTDKVRVHVHG